MHKQYIYTNNGDVSLFSKNITDMVESLTRKKNIKGILIVCVGTDRSTGDSLGPLLGYKLNHLTNDYFKVLGTLDNPVHAMNLERFLRKIECEYSDWLIIGIDASVGKSFDIGNIILKEDALYPGLGVNKNLGSFGDITITGIVTSYNKDIMNVRLSLVMNIADFIYNGILQARLFNNRTNAQKEYYFA